MHDDRQLVEARIDRELWQRVLPLAHRATQPLDAWCGPDLDHLRPIVGGESWGPPWATTWFRFVGVVPATWRGGRVEALVDLGFHPDAAGFQCEGLVVDVERGQRPVQGIHPRRMAVPIDVSASATGEVELLVEAASNPMLTQFRATPLGDPATAGERPLYRFRRAHLALVDREAEALAYDLEVLDGVMRAMAVDDPRRARLLRMIEAALDAVPDVATARHLLAQALGGASLGSTRPHRVFAVGHAHIDTAWLWPMRETVRKCTRTFASAVDLMDRHADYRFVCSSAQHHEWMRTEQPELFDAIVERTRRGQWIPVGGMWVESDMNLPSGESLARQIVHGQRWFEQHLGQRCEEVWIPDVFGYPAGLPQLFAHGGMRRFVTQKLSWNKQNRFPHHTFWWEGLDGTRVLTHFPPVDTYNAEIDGVELARSVRNFKDARWSDVSLMPYGYGDGGGGPTREMVERARRLASASPEAEIVLGTPDEFFDELEAAAASGADVPVWRGELYFETHRGTLTSQLATKVGNRRCERLLVEAELWAVSTGFVIETGEWWRSVLTQQFHDVLPGSSIAWVHQDAERVLTAVGDRVDRAIGELLGDALPAGRWLANPADTPIAGVSIVPAGAWRDAEHAQVLTDGSVAGCLAVPAFGIVEAAAEPCDDRVVVTDTSMANRHLAVRWDALGTITSIIAIDAVREVLSADGAGIGLELAPDHPVAYDAWDLESWTRRHARPLEGPVAVNVVDRGPLVGRVRVERAVGPSTFVLTYELRADDPALYVHLELDWHHDESLLSLAVPIDVRAEVATCDVQFGVVERPTHPSSPWDAAKFEVCAHRFVDVSEPSFGVAVLNDGRYGHALFDGAVRVSIARAAKYPDPTADHGHHRVTLAVLPHGPGLADVRAAAARLNRPVRAVEGRRSDPGVAPDPVVSLDQPGIGVDAVKSADDGSDDLVVRLHEHLGDRRRVTIAVRAGERIASAARCNLLEEPEASLDASDGVVALTLRPFELVTVRLRRAPAFDGR